MQSLSATKCSAKKRQNERGDGAPRKWKGSDCNESDQEQSGSSSGSACDTQVSENVHQLGAIDSKKYKQDDAGLFKEDRRSTAGRQFFGEGNDAGNTSCATIPAASIATFPDEFLIEIERICSGHDSNDCCQFNFF